ncbi:MAG TPA: hypothetical protein VE173_14000 [Longimicrobiales bacterium]|nr:hypothetical protein [Longimicrobiales bacterium]
MSDPAWIEQRMRTVQIIVLALVLGVVMFTGVAVAMIVAGLMSSGGELFGPGFLGFVALVVAVLLVLAPLLRRRVLESGESPQDEDAVLDRWMTATVVGMAVREGAGLMGVALALVSGSIPWTLIFGLASAAAMVLGWPRAEEVRERIRRIQAGA